MDSPKSASAITPEWLTSRLRASGSVGESSAVEQFDSSPIGTGKMGDTFRLGLEWSGPAGMDSVVAKFASSHEQSRQAGLLTGTYEREIRFFNELSTAVEINRPTSHHAHMDYSTGEFVLLMDDLTPAVVGDQIAGCSPDAAQNALRELVGLHAPDIPGLENLNWLVSKRPDGGDAMAVIYMALLPTFIGRYSGRLTDDTVKTAERFRDVVPNWLARSQGPYRLVHGDYRLDNLMFRNDQVFAVDWQTVGHGPPVSDVSYFCGASLETEIRREHEEELVREYHGELQSRTDGLMSWDRCWADYRLHAVSGLHMTVIAAALVTEDERGDQMFCAMAERHAAHVSDMGSLDLLADLG